MVELPRYDDLPSLPHGGRSGWSVFGAEDNVGFVEQDGPTRASFRRSPTTPGLAQDEALCRYLWDSRISAIGTDTYAVEALPGDPNLPMAFMHRLLIGQLGMALGELWWTHDLAADCDADGVHEMFFCSAPLNAPGGVGSPANAIAIK